MALVLLKIEKNSFYYIDYIIVVRISRRTLRFGEILFLCSVKKNSLQPALIGNSTFTVSNVPFQCVRIVIFQGILLFLELLEVSQTRGHLSYVSKCSLQIW